ncbi:hypothetical protein Tco_0894225 [Tanacetum coccineum]|uniref:Uncharacterized protein n=1 Tax=Tanacetum coccineum TaxID=301880 RepID=A0ABQ5CDU4_9ASTR
MQGVDGALAFVTKGDLSGFGEGERTKEDSETYTEMNEGSLGRGRREENPVGDRSDGMSGGMGVLGGGGAGGGTCTGKGRCGLMSLVRGNARADEGADEKMGCDGMGGGGLWGRGGAWGNAGGRGDDLSGIGGGEGGIVSRGLEEKQGEKSGKYEGEEGCDIGKRRVGGVVRVRLGMGGVEGEGKVEGRNLEREERAWSGLRKEFLYKQETASKSRQARDGKQESSSKSRQARVDKKETGGKQETAIDEKAQNTVKECTNWKDKKKDKEQEALLISEDTAFVITGENIGPKPNPDLFVCCPVRKRIGNGGRLDEPILGKIPIDLLITLTDSKLILDIRTYAIRCSYETYPVYGDKDLVDVGGLEGTTVRERLSGMATCIAKEGVTSVGRIREEDERVAFVSRVFNVTPSIGTVVMEEEVALLTGVDRGFGVVTRGVAARTVYLLT